jgi:hypothetical protein
MEVVDERPARGLSIALFSDHVFECGGRRVGPRVQQKAS